MRYWILARKAPLLPMNKNEGFIIKIQGPVVDVRFPVNPPSINEALVLETGDKKQLILEVAFITGDNEVKTLSMGPTDGLKRGMKVERTNSPIKVPTGPKTLGRIFNRSEEHTSELQSQ